MVDIYWAAPLHEKSVQAANGRAVYMFRKEGYNVYLPQEHGVVEEVLKQFDNDKTKAKPYFYKLDVIAMNRCDVCIVYHSRKEAPSEGQLFEMGYMKGQGKPIIVINESEWDFGLMIEYGADFYCNSIEEALAFMKNEGF